MHNFFEVYEHRWRKFNHHRAKEELILLTCKVFPAVQMAWMHFVPRTTNHKKYFKVVSGSNEAFGLFLLKNYKS